MQKLFWEDFHPGTVTEHGPRLVTAEEIVAFAAEFDPQPMHLDAEVARGSMLGALAASGWHGCCLVSRMVSEALLINSSFRGAPGVEEVRWLAPLRAGEAITLRANVLETRPSRSRTDMGFVRFRLDLHDASGTRLLSLTVNAMFGRRQHMLEPEHEP